MLKYNVKQIVLMILERLKQVFCDHDFQQLVEVQTEILNDQKFNGIVEFFQHIKSFEFEFWEESHQKCTKCGKEKHDSVCDHDWSPVKDGGVESLYDGVKAVKVAVCSKCGIPRYRASSKISDTSC